MSAEPPIEIDDEPPDVIYVSFSAEINAHTTESLLATMATCANQRIPKVHLLISTPGGSVMNGMNLYNVLRGMPFELTTHNVGNVESIGNAVFLAGSRRLACAHSTFMFHGVTFDGTGSVLDEKLLRERLDALHAEHVRIAGVMADRTALTTEEIAPLFMEAQTKDATYAVGAGIVHEIADVEIPPGSPVVALVFQR